MKGERMEREREIHELLIRRNLQSGTSRWTKTKPETDSLQRCFIRLCPCSVISPELQNPVAFKRHLYLITVVLPQERFLTTVYTVFVKCESALVFYDNSNSVPLTKFGLYHLT